MGARMTAFALPHLTHPLGGSRMAARPQACSSVRWIGALALLRALAAIPAAPWICMVLAACLATAAGATTMARLDTRDLTLQSSDIVIGTVNRVNSYWTPDHRRI